MKHIIKPVRLLIFTNILAVVQAVYLFPKLPAKVPVLFSSSGLAGSFHDKLFVTIFMLLVIILLSVLFFLLSKFLHKVPYALLNIPYKSYWLTDRNMEMSLNIIAGEMLKIISLTNLLLIAMYQLISNASINGSYKLAGNSWWLIIAYLIFVSYNIVKMYRFFGNPKNT